MTKNTIYIDVEDDITTIIGKIKASEGELIALIPPKRIGVLQSAVNLRLVARAAKSAQKKLVIVTHNEALKGLAGSAMIPVAASLTSQPKIPDSPGKIKDEDEIIQGNSTPVENRTEIDSGKTDEKVAKAVPTASAGESSTNDKSAKEKSKKKIKVPNFSKLRIKIAVALLAVMGLIGFLVWAIIFAPNAKITIAARTTNVAINRDVTLSESLPTDVRSSVLNVSVETMKKEVSIPFKATGEKDVGDKATGLAQLINCSDFNTVVKAGTAISAGDRNYLIAQDVLVPASDFNSGGVCKENGNSQVEVTAQKSGEQYNAPAQSYQVAGQPTMRASAGEMTGGTTKIAKVATTEDIEKAMDVFNEKYNQNDIKKELAEKIAQSGTPLEKTFKSDNKKIQPTVAVDEEIGDKELLLKGTAIYSMASVAAKDIEKFFGDYMAKEVDGKPSLKVYESGAKEATFTNVDTTEKGYKAVLSSNGTIGPNIDESEIKNYAKDKRSGEVQAYIEAISGVDSADVQLAPFWVSTVPNDDKRIVVEFNLNGEQ